MTEDATVGADMTAEEENAQRNRRCKRKPTGASRPRGFAASGANGSGQSADPLNDLLERSKDDSGAPFEAEEIFLLRSMAGTKPADFERFWARLKSETKVRCGRLEEVLKESSPDGGGDGAAGRRVTFDEIEPWPDAVDGAELLTEVAVAIRSYVVMDPHQCDAAALLALFTHVHDLRDYAPLLIVKSPMRRCGKTKLQEMLALLTPRPRPMSGVTAPLLARLIEKHRPTLFIDEYDAISHGDKEMAESLRGQLNSSFNRRSAAVLKLVSMPGNGWEEREFSTWAPTCIAGIGAVPDTIEDRSIIIELTRKLRDEKVRRLRGKDGDDLVVLARKIARWVRDNERRLRDVEPSTPAALNDRQADAWDPLLAIADVAGGDWPKRARGTALALCQADEADAAERDVRIMMLMDIRDIFNREFPPDHPDRGEERKGRPDDGPRLSSKRLLEELLALEERPWIAFGKVKKPMTGMGLASLLRPYRVHSRTARVDGAGLAKAYFLRSFDDAFARYLTSPPLQVVTSEQMRRTLGKMGFLKSEQTKCVTSLEMPETPAIPGFVLALRLSGRGKGGRKEKPPPKPRK
jgi:putative DNA primase/helicase